jgi:hypothetical protein
MWTFAGNLQKTLKSPWNLLTAVFVGVPMFLCSEGVSEPVVQLVANGIPKVFLVLDSDPSGLNQTVAEDFIRIVEQSIDGPDPVCNEGRCDDPCLPWRKG